MYCIQYIYWITSKKLNWKAGSIHSKTTKLEKQEDKPVRAGCMKVRRNINQESDDEVSFVYKYYKY